MDDYKAILNRMRAQRANLDQAIAAMEKLVGEGNGALPSLGSGTGVPIEVAPDAFYSLSLVEATKKYLKLAGPPARSTDEILAALVQGGLPDATKDSLGSVLIRATKGREVRKVGKGLWGLSEWYQIQGST